MAVGKRGEHGIVIRAAHFPGRAPIDAYGNGGFRFADMSHKGSILCLPSGIYGWEPANPAAVAAEDLSRVLSEAGEIELLLIGTGTILRPPSAVLRGTLKQAGVTVEPMATGPAVRTFNVLLAEDRAVAAALIAVD
ncbi:uncharacterized protein L598_000300001600 [Mesorhizobium sp. J18]|uniref:Mth938-like domain-containing protein n=1 Tax=Mesorhizobium sp. J18 TaxID=935263 RepID=UPI00119A982B|nr:Mth938-like domain-containing protein [Mesorhizobium sp. J18]TWG95556.1 uncharacterized protein L598_000300001600 [Mesorhizobium sp. J18]